MNHVLSLHHCAYRITPNNLEFVMELFTKLGCKESRARGARWRMIKQEGKDTIIQFHEIDQEPQDTEVKRNSHIGFLSDDPEKSVAYLKKWIEDKGIKTEDGSWSDKELYFDCPEVFVDFVVEIMHTSIVD